MTRKRKTTCTGAVAGSIGGISQYSGEGIVTSDPAGLFDWVGGAASAVSGAVSGAAQAAQKAAADAAAAAKRQAEEQARRVAEATAAAKRQAEEQARRVAEAARKAAEEQARRVAEAAAAAKRAAEEQARRVAEEQARRVAEAAAAAKRAAEEQARRVAEEQAKRVAEAAAAAKKQVEEQARRVAEEQAKRVAEAAAAAKRQAEEQARKASEQIQQQTGGAVGAVGSYVRSATDAATGAVGTIANVVQDASKTATSGGLSQSIQGVVGAGVGAAAAVEAATRAAAAEAERRMQELERQMQAERDRNAAETAARLAEEEAKKSRSTFDLVGIAQDAYQGAQDAAQGVYRGVVEFTEASVSDKIKGVGDVIANVPAAAFTGLTVELGAGISGAVTGTPVSEAEKQRLKDLQQAYISDSIYNVYATPGHVIDLATTVIDIGDEVFGSGEYERTHIADDIKKGIFKRDEVGSHVPGSQLGYGTQYDRDALKTQAFEQWSSDVREGYGDVAGLGADLAGGITTAWHDMPIVEGAMWLGGTGLGTFLGQAGRPIAAAFAAEQITGAVGDALLGEGEETERFTGSAGAMNTFIATQNVDDQTTAPVSGQLTANVDYQDVLDQYAAEYLAAQQYLEEQYRSEQAIYEQQLADYQAQLDREYQQSQNQLESEYADVISQYDEQSAEYAKAVSEYQQAQESLEQQYQSELDEYQTQIDEAAAAQAKEYADAIAEYERAVAELASQSTGTRVSGQSLLSGSVGGTTTWEPGTVTGGFTYGQSLIPETSGVDPVSTVSSTGPSAALIAGAAGVSLLAGWYFLSGRAGKPRGTL